MTDKEGWAIFATAMTMLEDVPGDTLLERIARLKEWHLQFQTITADAQRDIELKKKLYSEAHDLRAALTQFVAACETAPPTSLMTEIGMACKVAKKALADSSGVRALKGET